MAGLIHIYCGDGKGKTTAAVGLAVRAAGAGKRVLFVQFFKDGSSSELKILDSIDNIHTDICEVPYGFFRNMSASERAQATSDYTELLLRVLDSAKRDADLLILDEAISACNYHVIPETALLDFLQTKPPELEVVLTGRDPSEALLAWADYVTEMKKIRHPFDKGINARYGVEY